MATSSIMKQFTVKDVDAFERLITEAEKTPIPKKPTDNSALLKGREELEQFSFR